MKISIEKGYYSEDNVVTITGLNNETMERLSKAFFTDFVPPEPTKEYKKLGAMSPKQQSILRDVMVFMTARDYMKSANNKINQIMLLRHISELGIKEAKDFVDWLLWGSEPDSNIYIGRTGDIE